MKNKNTTNNKLRSPTGSIFYPSKEKKWTGVDWPKVEKIIENLQHRITKAAERRQHRKIRYLQFLLTRSLSARLKATRIVAQENQGKKTPGIDGELWATSDRKLKEALTLRKKRHTKPLLRMYIPKANGNKRPLGIPCMSDRACQALWNMALIPVTEATSDPHSYGFRPYRDCWDANAQIRHHLDKQTAPEWILDADIEKCFDKINHDWLLRKVPMDKKILKSWLKAGYLEAEGNQLFQTDEGTPQGGIISPTLANLTLNGLEEHLKQKFKPGKVQRFYKGKSNGTRSITTSIHPVRYADDLIITGRSKRQLERVKDAINEFLAPRGLRINEKKTSIRHISKGFDFLGWNFRKYNNNKSKSTILCKISKESIYRHRREMKYTIKKISKPEVLILTLSSKIRGWMNYHCCTNGLWKVWGAMDKYIYERVMKWCQRRHSNKSKEWLYLKYWKTIKNWKTFTVSDLNNKIYELQHYNKQQAKAGVRVSSYMNVFDLKNKEIIRKKMLAKRNGLSHQKGLLWRKQKGSCPFCKQYMDPLQSDILDIHHVMPKKDGGSDKISNLILLHEHCHYAIHANTASNSKTQSK